MPVYKTAEDKYFDIRVAGSYYEVQQFAVEEGLIFIPLSPGEIFTETGENEAAIKIYPCSRLNEITRRRKKAGWKGTIRNSNPTLKGIISDE